MIMVADFTGELRLELQLLRSAAKRTMFLITEFIRHINPKKQGRKVESFRSPVMNRTDFK